MATSTYGQQMIDRLLMQFKNSPYLHGILDAVGVELDLLTTTFNELRELRWIDTATGTQLDGCGEIVARTRKIEKAVAIPFFGFYEQLPYVTGFGQARFRDSGEAYTVSRILGDNDYRRVLWAKVAYNTTGGTTEETISSLTYIAGARVLIQEIGNAKIAVYIGREVTSADLTLLNGLNLLVRAGGVNAEIAGWFVDGKTFGFSNYPTLGYVGFGQGILAKTM